MRNLFTTKKDTLFHTLLYCSAVEGGTEACNKAFIWAWSCLAEGAEALELPVLPFHVPWVKPATGTEHQQDWWNFLARGMQKTVVLHSSQNHLPGKFHDFAILAALLIDYLHNSLVVTEEINIPIRHFDSKDFNCCNNGIEFKKNNVFSSATHFWIRLQTSHCWMWL